MSPPSEGQGSLKATSESEENVELEGCGGSLLCDPRRPYHRFIVLIFICFLSFGSYFCFDNPAALQKDILRDMKVNKKQYMQLYAWYSWPNVVLCFFGGFLIDRVFGIRLGTIIFSCFVMVGQILFGLGAYFGSFAMMEGARFVFGIGGESLAVAQNTYAVSWFKGNELNMVFGLQLSFSRVGSTVNMNVMQPIYDKLTQVVKPKVGETHVVLGYTLLFGFVMCMLSLVCGLVMAFFDRRASRILKKTSAKTGEVIHITDIKHFPMSVWLIYLICVLYYVAVFPFIGLGLVFFQSKWGFSASEANACNSLVYLISAGASPLLGIMVDRLGKNVLWLIIAVAATLGAHAMLAFTFWNPFFAMAIMGVAYSLLACALWPLVAMIVPEHQLGTAYGFMQSIQNLGLGVVSNVAGSIVDTNGYLILEVFFTACLCFALMSSVMLYLWDLANGGKLNASTSLRKIEKNKTKKLAAVTQEDSEKEPLLNDNYYRSPPSGTTPTPIRAASADQLRNRFLARVGGMYLQIPDTFRTSAFVFPHVLK